MTQEQVSNYLQMPQGTYQHYENDRAVPSIDTLCKLADLYDVSLDYLVGREYINDIGYFTSEQKPVVKKLKALSEVDLARVDAYIDGLKENKK